MWYAAGKILDQYWSHNWNYNKIKFIGNFICGGYLLWNEHSPVTDVPRDIWTFTMAPSTSTDDASIQHELLDTDPFHIYDIHRKWYVKLTTVPPLVASSVVWLTVYIRRWCFINLHGCAGLTGGDGVTTGGGGVMTVVDCVVTVVDGVVAGGDVAIVGGAVITGGGVWVATAGA